VAWQDDYFERYYDRAKGWKDGTTEFHELCAVSLGSGGRILEIGAGPTNDSTDYLATLGEVHGVDPDPDVKTNTALASAELLDHGRFPFDDASFDGAVSNFVMEHVEDPATHLAELNRVLKPGGAYVFRTPNRFHYVPLVAGLTPHWFHVKVANRLRGLSEEAHDPYPTVYRMNSRAAVRRHAEQAGLEVETLRVIEKEPSYGRASRLLFFGFMAYERLVNSTDALQDLRVNILCTLRTPRSA